MSGGGCLIQSTLHECSAYALAEEISSLLEGGFSVIYNHLDSLIGI
jgi:hypothetical protein